MVHIGTLAITTKTDHGVFHCPQCAEQRIYQRKIKRRFLTLYFIPIFPLDIASDKISCQACKSTFDANVLENRPATRRSAADVHLRRVLLLMTMGGGSIDDATFQQLQQIYLRLTGETWSQDELLRDVGYLHSAKLTASEYLKKVVLSLGEPAKDRIVAGAFLAASLRGELDPRQLHELMELPQALNISETRFRKLVERAP